MISPILQLSISKRVLFSLIFSVICITVVPNRKAQAGWKTALGSNIAQGIEAGQPFFVNNNIGFVLADNESFIAKTTDGGMNWETINVTPSISPLLGIHFIDANTGWICGSQGKAYKTIDGGITWTSINVNSSGTISDIQFIDENTGWAVDTRGRIKKSTNGGESWVQMSDGDYSIEDVFFLDADTGWVVGENGLILKSTNGGFSWETQTSNVSDSLQGIFFLNANNGWAVGEEGIVLRTIDGGTTWTSLSTDSDSERDGVWFSDVNNGFIFSNEGDREAFKKTTDGGNTWTDVNIGNISSNRIKGIWNFSATNMYAVTKDGGYTSNDGGSTWAATSNLTVGKRVERVYFSSLNTVWAVGSGIFKSLDAGTNWTEVNTGVSENFSTGSFVSDQQGWVAVYYSGTLYRTTDGGSTWTAQITGHTGGFWDMKFLDYKTGWAVGENGAIFNTSDGGATWNSQASGVTTTLRSVDFVDRNTGWIGGDGGVLLKTTNGGATWVAQTSGVNGRIVDIKMANSLEGWASSEEDGPSRVLKTTNGGTAWTAIDPGFYDQYFTVNKIVLSSPQTVLFSGRSFLAATTDGGTTWTKHTPHAGNYPISRRGNVLLAGHLSEGVVQKQTVSHFFSGITIDSTAPTAGFATDTGALTSSASALHVSWSGFSDNQAITHYEVSVGTSAGDTSILGWIHAGVNTQYLINNLSLVGNTNYFINVRAKDLEGNISNVVSTDGIQIQTDQVAPTGGTVTDDGASTKSTTQLSASWSGFTDASGIAEYSYSIGISAGNDSVKGWTSAGTNTRILVTGLTLNFGGNYFINVRAKDTVGNLSSVVSSNGILVETVGGDMDGNGIIDLNDAKLANSFATGKGTPTAAQILFADVFEPKDGKITTEDANLILRCAKGTIRGNPQYPWCPALTREASATDVNATEGGAP